MSNLQNTPAEPELRYPPNMGGASLKENRRITALPRLTVYPRIRARTPRRLGFNVELQCDHDRINLWDWLADSGAAVVREFHPEVNMRRHPVAADAWGSISNREDFDTLRARFRADGGGPVDESNYLFGEAIPWLGVPDAIVRRIQALGIHPMIPMGYVPRMFPRPLVRDPERLEPADDEAIDWGAAASAYDYYTAMIRHYATGFGCTTFMLVNEPEYRSGGFYLPARVEGSGPDLFQKIFVALDDVELWRLYFRSLAVQMGVLARVARMAMDDVRSTLVDRNLAGRLELTGPVSGNLDDYWPLVGPFVDCCDYHQYSPHPEAYRERFRRACELARPGGRRIVLSEFNRQAGEMSIANTYFPIAESLELGRLLLTILQVCRDDDPVFEAATLYHFHFPATHRNYKSLVYGDMNRVDWTGMDARPAGPEDHPTTDELQVRFATPAYHMFRMVARMTGTDASNGRPFPVLDTSWMIRDTSRVPDMTGALEMVAVDRGDSLVVTILNRSARQWDDFTLDIGPLGRDFGWVVIRETSQALADCVTGEEPVVHGLVRVRVAPKCCIQAIFSNIAPSALTDAVLSETTHTPGRLADLALWQTTRLVLTAALGRSRLNLSTHNIIWESDQPQRVRVGQGGLVQRVRNTDRTVTIRARLADGRVLGEARVPPASCAAAHGGT
jgi:hypothetical protein